MDMSEEEVLAIIAKVKKEQEDGVKATNLNEIPPNSTRKNENGR